MTQPSQSEQPTLGDLVLRDLETQIAVDTRYAAKCKELALVRAQYGLLMEFVQSKADVLGLKTVEEVTGQADAVEPPVAESPAVEESAAPREPEKKAANTKA